MKAVVYTEYGAPDVLELKEVRKPASGDDEVLVKVHAVSLNASDYEFLSGEPLYVRMWGLFKPNKNILGSDIAGKVEAVGKDVKLFKPGDEVFGDILYSKGGFAEYAIAPEEAIARKPDNMTFEEVAAIPQAGVVALQGLRDKRDIKPGDKVLINGAGGGSGTFAIQIAKLFGAEVTGVDSTRKLDTMLSLGADHVIDYTKEDFTLNAGRYDFILDLTARHSIFDCRRALSPGGIYVLVGGGMAEILQAVFLAPLISIFGNKKMGFLAWRPNRNDLLYMTELFTSGKVVPVIDSSYPLSEVPRALGYLGEGHALGKVVITVR